MTHDLARKFHASSNGYILSPAGYGKTETIVDSVACSIGKQLVLTHTHAGVQSLRKRFERKQVPKAFYHVDTIDSFTFSYLLHYPCPPFCSTQQEEMDGEKYWSNIRNGFLSLLDYSFFRSLLKLLYAGVYVDEYQDTSCLQHQIILKMSKFLPCRIVGDPCQSILAFHAGDVIVWERDVVPNFEKISELTIPQRWRAINPEFGKWLADARIQIFQNGRLDFQNAPTGSVKLERAPSYRERSFAIQKIARGLDSSVIITNWQAQRCHQLARVCRGLISSMEEMECRDLKEFAKSIVRADNTARAMIVAEFLYDIMTGAGKAVTSNLERLLKGKAPRNEFFLKHQALFNALHQVAMTGSYESIHHVLSIAATSLGGHVFRREIHHETLHSLSYAFAHGVDLTAAVEAVRYRTRTLGRVPTRHTLSRVLLVKGLEFPHSIVLNPELMTAKELYVAITRSINTLTVFSDNSCVTPKIVH